MSYLTELKNTEIELKNIIIDEKIADMIESIGKVFPADLLNNLQDYGTFELSTERLESIQSVFETGQLPPISVKAEWGGKYSVQNGRHRICAVILNGGTTIPCDIQNNTVEENVIVESRED